MSDDTPEPDLADADTPAEAALADEIRRRRKLAGLSHAELAARIGYSRQYVSRAERPRKGLASAELVRAIDTALHADGALTDLHTHALTERRARRARLVAHDRRVARPPATDRSAEQRRQAPASIGFGDTRSATERPIWASDGNLVDGPVDPLNRNDFLRLTAAAFAGAAASNAIAAMLADPQWDPAASTSWAADTYQAVLNPIEQVRQCADASEDGRPRPLRPLVDQVMARSLAADYGELEKVLPGLVGRAEFAALHAQDRGQAHAALADVYSVIGWVLIKADNPLGAWISAQRAIRAAEEARDPVRTAAATRCLAEVHMRNGNYEKATRTALVATVQLDSRAAALDARRALPVRGAALLSAAAASARNGERREAYASLQAAAQCADDIGRECFELATVFGPTNVAIHRVAVAIELRDAPAALRHAESVQLDQLPKLLAERKARFLLDVARAQAAVTEFGEALNALLCAEKISAEEVRHHRITRQLVSQLLAHDRRGSGLREFARRCDIAV